MSWEWISDNPTLSKAISGTALALRAAAPAVEDWLYAGAEGVKSTAAQKLEMMKEANLLKYGKGLADDAYEWMGGSGKYTYKPGGGLSLLNMAATGGTPLERKLYQNLAKYISPTLRFASNPFVLGAELALHSSPAGAGSDIVPDLDSSLVGQGLVEGITISPSGSSGLISQGTTDTSQSVEIPETPDNGGGKINGKTKGNGKVTGGDGGEERTTKTTKTTPYVTPYVGDPTGRTAKPDPFRFEDTKAAARGRVTAPTTTTTRGIPPRRGPHG
jgi:hypothetical protein